VRTGTPNAVLHTFGPADSSRVQAAPREIRSADRATRASPPQRSDPVLRILARTIVTKPEPLAMRSHPSPSSRQERRMSPRTRTTASTKPVKLPREHRERAAQQGAEVLVAASSEKEKRT
jgi:hypothetical protein